MPVSLVHFIVAAQTVLVVVTRTFRLRFGL